MFKNHQPIISEYGRANPDNMARVLKFVILTIQTRLFNIPADMAALESARVPEELAGVLYGWKPDAVLQIDADKAAIFHQAESIYYHAANDREAAEELLPLFAQLRGLGLAKSGFACQLIYGVSACLDSHNIERFGIPWQNIKSSGLKNAKKLATRRKWISRYCDYVDKCGGTESLWDSWCEYVFNRPDETGFRMNGNRRAYESAYHVSALHCESLGLAAD